MIEDRAQKNIERAFRESSEKAKRGILDDRFDAEPPYGEELAKEKPAVRQQRRSARTTQGNKRP